MDPDKLAQVGDRETNGLNTIFSLRGFTSLASVKRELQDILDKS